MPTCPSCGKWLTRKQLVAGKGATSDAPHDRCPRDGTRLLVAEPLPPGGQVHRAPRDVGGSSSLWEWAALLGVLLFVVCAVGGGYIGLALLAAGVVLTLVTGDLAFAIGGIVLGLALAAFASWAKENPIAP